MYGAAMLAIATLLSSATPTVSRAAAIGCAWREGGDTVRRGRATLRLRLNVAGRRVDAIDSGRVVARFPVAVGTKQYPTPVGRFVVTRVTWNPWWIPPKSWWARNDTVTPPGPRNPMGRAKIMLREPYYLHGTPDSGSIGHARSHGCVRMRQEDVVVLARRVLDAVGAPVSDSTLATLMASRETRETVPRDSVVLESVYEIAEVVGDTLLLHSDIYRWGLSRRREAARALLAAGLDTAAFDLGRLPRRVPESGRRVALDRLRRVPAPALVLPTLPLADSLPPPPPARAPDGMSGGVPDVRPIRPR